MAHRNLSFIAALVASGLLTGTPASAQALDPYGPRLQHDPMPARNLSRVTRLLTVEDGTPRYELVPSTSLARSDTMDSQMLSFSLQDFLPVDAGRSSPIATGEHGGTAVVHWHYLVKFWEEWPNAKERPGDIPMLGHVSRDIDLRILRGQPQPPAAVKAALDAQAARFRDAIHAWPFIQRSEGVTVENTISYHRDRDPAGVEVWGFRLKVIFGVLGSATDEPRQLPSGRWISNAFDGSVIEVCTNCFEEMYSPVGRYRGFQMVGWNWLLVDTLETPLWTSQYRSGEGPLISNPSLYDSRRPDTDIQVLVVKSPARQVGEASNMAPDNEAARAIAAAWLIDWKSLVDQGNSPSAPRAD